MISITDENIRTALEFLERLHPSAVRHLVAIEPDGRILIRSFGADQRDAAESFIKQHNGVRNLYVHVNELQPNVRNAKASKAHVALAAYAHVDIDDPSGLERLREFRLPPTVLVASGGGYNAYWRLKPSLHDLEHAESINRWLVQELGGDRAATDVSRILRIPGTVNLPTKVKRARGRMPVIAHVVGEMTDWSRAYEPSQFGMIAIKAGDPSTQGKPVPDTASLGACDLPADFDPRLSRVAELGDDPERPRTGPNPRYPSRSEAVYAVACALARKGLSREQIGGVLLNPSLGISASLRDKRRPEEAALRQTDRAIRVVGSSWPDGVDPRTGVPRRTFLNTQTAIERLEISCGYDVFRNRYSVSGHVVQESAGEFSDKMVLVIRDIICKAFRFDPGTDGTLDAIKAVSHLNTFDPICDYLDGLVWDGVPRLDMFLITFAGAEDTPFVRHVSAIMLIAAVKRARQPGVKFDTIPVLEGPQGSGKSTLLIILAGSDFFSDMDLLASDQKTQMEAMEGVWIYELGELAGMRYTDVNKVKAFASRSVDKARPAYGRVAEVRKRRGILVGTTNDDQYLKDETGNRRFWPITTGKIDLASIAALRDQLWAEAAVREAQGEGIVLPEELWQSAAIEQGKRVPPDAWQEVLEAVRGDACRGREQITSRDLLMEVLNIPANQIDSFKSRRLARVMKVLGWTGPVTLTLRNGGKQKGYWRYTSRPDDRDAPI